MYISLIKKNYRFVTVLLTCVEWYSGRARMVSAGAARVHVTGVARQRACPGCPACPGRPGGPDFSAYFYSFLIHSRHTDLRVILILNGRDFHGLCIL